MFKIPWTSPFNIIRWAKKTWNWLCLSFTQYSQALFCLVACYRRWTDSGLKLFCPSLELFIYWRLLASLASLPSHTPPLSTLKQVQHYEKVYFIFSRHLWTVWREKQNFILNEIWGEIVMERELFSPGQVYGIARNWTQLFWLPYFAARPFDATSMDLTVWQ